MYWYSEGKALFEVADLIPQTTKQKERSIMLSSCGLGSTTGVERVLLEEAAMGNRSNTMIKWALFIKDSGYDYDDAEAKVLEFNEKLPEPLAKREVEKTILATLKRSYK